MLFDIEDHIIRTEFFVCLDQDVIAIGAQRTGSGIQAEHVEGIAFPAEGKPGGKDGPVPAVVVQPSPGEE